MNELLNALSVHLPARIRIDVQGSAAIYSVYTDGAWIPMYQEGAASGWWVHGERHLEYGLREEADARGWDWRLEWSASQAQARVSGAQRMCSGQGQRPVHTLACALLNLLEQCA